MRDDSHLYCRSRYLQRSRLLPKITPKMASKRIQARLVGPSSFPLHILFAVEYLPTDIGRRTKEDIRSHSSILQRVQRSNSAVFRPGFYVSIVMTSGGINTW